MKALMLQGFAVVFGLALGSFIIGKGLRRERAIAALVATLCAVAWIVTYTWG